VATYNELLANIKELINAMPVTLRKKKSGKYSVSTPNQTHAKDTTFENAKAQERLLNAVEHGWKPTGKKKRGKK
jgi:hypothetical protein